MANALYERRDQSFNVTVYDTDGVTVIPASTYQNAQYRIYPASGCVPVLSKELNSGVTVVGDNFVVTIAAADLTVSGINGEYRHVFVVGTTPTEVLPSIFNETVDIVAGCEI